MAKRKRKSNRTDEAKAATAETTKIPKGRKRCANPECGQLIGARASKCDKCGADQPMRTKSAKSKRRGRPAGTTTKAATNGDVIGAFANLVNLARKHTVKTLRSWLDKLDD